MRPVKKNDCLSRANAVAVEEEAVEGEVVEVDGAQHEVDGMGEMAFVGSRL
jgi:hypothetical protein